MVMTEEKKKEAAPGEPAAKPIEEAKEKPAEKTQAKPEEKPLEAKADTPPGDTAKDKLEPKKEELKQEAPKKEETPAKKEKPSNCAGCNKPIKKKRWYYRNGKFYCSKTCWAEISKKEAEKPQAAAAGQPPSESK